MSRRINRATVDALVTRAYFKLVLVPWDANKSRAITLATFCNREVRLVELLDPSDFMPNLWLELHDLVSRATLDSCACRDLETAARGAEQLLARAGMLETEGELAPEKDDGGVNSDPSAACMRTS